MDSGGGGGGGGGGYKNANRGPMAGRCGPSPGASRRRPVSSPSPPHSVFTLSVPGFFTMPLILQFSILFSDEETVSLVGISAVRYTALDLS